MKTFYLGSLGCPRRGVDSQKIYDYMELNGFSFTEDYQNADLVVISTCAFNNDREDKSVAGIKHYRQVMHKHSKLIVAGCLSKINPDIIDESEDIQYLSPRELDTLDEIIDAEINFKDIPEANIINDFPLCFENQENKTKKTNQSELNRRLDSDYDKNKLFTIRIAKGCLGTCSFCAIKFATGKLESKHLSQITSEFMKGLQNGYTHFLLVAGDTGCYGLDIGTSIIELLSAVLSINRSYKIILKEFNAQWLIKYYSDLEKLLTEHQEKIDYIIIPVQSASNKILKLMKRPYKIENVINCIKNLKQKIPMLRMTTHIMTGFPGETEEDFQESLDFISQFSFPYVDFYSYEDRPNTEASRFDNKVPQEIINTRLRRLKETQERILQNAAHDKKGN